MTGAVTWERVTAYDYGKKRTETVYHRADRDGVAVGAVSAYNRDKWRAIRYNALPKGHARTSRSNTELGEFDTWRQARKAVVDSLPASTVSS
jgi:hypothetical protein